MRDFQDFVEICPVCQHSAVVPDISLISLSIGSYLELAIFGEDFPSVASVNVRFSWVFYFVFICSGYKLNSPHYVMGEQVPACFHWELSRLPEVTIFAKDACMLNPVREGEEDWSDSLPSSLENFWKFLVFFVLSVSCCNIRFGAISNFRPTNSASSRENLRNRVHLFHHLWIFETIFSLFLGRFRRFRIPVISQHRCVQRGS